MKKFVLLTCLAASTFLLPSCKDESGVVGTAPIEDYSPFVVGKYITYQLDSIVPVNFGASLATRTYEVKYVVDAAITDANNRPSYRIVRFMKKTNGSWESDATFLATPTTNGLEFVENNLRYVKLRITSDMLYFLSSYEPSFFVSLYNKGFIWKKENYYFIHPFIKEVLIRLLGSSKVTNAEIGKYYEGLIQTNDFSKEQNTIRTAILYYENSRLEAAKEFKKRMYENFSQKEINSLYEQIVKKRRLSKTPGAKPYQSNYAIEFAKNVTAFGYSISSQQLKEAKKLLLENLNKNQPLETYLFLGNICRKLSRVISNKEELIEARKYLELARDIAPYNIDTLITCNCLQRP